MKVSLRKRMIAGAIATLLSAPAWTASVTADDPAKARTGAQSGTEMKSDTERSSGTTGTSQSGSATGTTSGSAGAGTSGSAGAGASGSAGAGASGSAATGASGSAGTGASGSAGTGTSASGSGATSPSMGASSTSRSMGAGAAKADNPLYARTVDDLKGTDIVDASGKEIGEIKEIVLTQDRRSAHAVVSVGGFLGIGDRDIVVSLDELRPAEDDKLQLNATKDELKARPKFESEQYVELEGDQPISGSITDFAAFETNRNRTTGAARDSGKTMDKTVDKTKTMDKDKDMRQPSTESGAAGGSSGTTGSGTTGSGTSGSGTTK